MSRRVTRVSDDAVFDHMDGGRRVLLQFAGAARQ